MQLYFIVSDSDILGSDKKFAGGVCQRKAQFLQRTFGSGKLPNETLHEWSGPSPPLKVTIGKVTFHAYYVLWARFCVNSCDRFFQLFPNFFGIPFSTNFSVAHTIYRMVTLYLFPRYQAFNTSRNFTGRFIIAFSSWWTFMIHAWKTRRFISTSKGTWSRLCRSHIRSHTDNPKVSIKICTLFQTDATLRAANRMFASE